MLGNLIIKAFSVPLEKWAYKKERKKESIDQFSIYCVLLTKEAYANIALFLPNALIEPCQFAKAEINCSLFYSKKKNGGCQKRRELLSCRRRGNWTLSKSNWARLCNPICIAHDDEVPILTWSSLSYDTEHNTQGRWPFHLITRFDQCQTCNLIFMRPWQFVPIYSCVYRWNRIMLGISVVIRLRPPRRE